MIIDCVADLHGFYPKLDGGDLLIVAGDLTATDKGYQYNLFRDWLTKQNYKSKIIIAGNHDNLIANGRWKIDPPEDFEYLCDSGTQFEGMKIWGTPWTKTFEGMNPHCKAFTCDTEEQLDSKFSLIPDDIDILITHSPPYGIFDKCQNGHVGSESLKKHMFRIKMKLIVFGHIHECGFSTIDLGVTKAVNCSYVNEHYQPVNKPVRVIL
jgi:Icc-related predicted phosphoesterase